MANKTKFGKFGAYLSPVVVIGAFVPCDLRGVVRIVGMSAGPIAWPIGEKNSQEALVIYKGLARALKLETAADVAAWWGIDEQAVQRWQSGQPEPLRAKAASADLAADLDEPQERRRAWQSLDRDGQKNSAQEGATGATATKATAEPWRKKWFPPVVDGHSHTANLSRKRRWEPWEDDLVRTCPVEEVVRRTQPQGSGGLGPALSAGRVGTAQGDAIQKRCRRSRRRAAGTTGRQPTETPPRH